MGLRCYTSAQKRRLQTVSEHQEQSITEHPTSSLVHYWPSPGSLLVRFLTIKSDYGSSSSRREIVVVPLNRNCLSNILQMITRLTAD